MEMLKATNWMPWKRRMQAVLRDLGLEKYVAKDAKIPESADPQRPTTEEKEAARKWVEGNAKVQTRIELAISDPEMIHISGAMSVWEMWDQLTMVKESKGKLGVLATRRTLYRMTADEGFDMVEHISKLRKLQEELHLMENKVEDEDFVMILITSLPESWDNYTSSYLASSGNKPTLKSHELVAVLLEEFRRRQGRTGETSGGISMQVKGHKGGKFSTRSSGNSEKECFNCHKKGHISKECWAKGGGREGQGPKGRKGPNREQRSNQAQESIKNSLGDVAYATNNHEFSKYDWILDSGTTSHLCVMREAFIDYTEVNSEVHGVGPNPAIVKGRGTVVVNFKVDGHMIRHTLRNVLHVPEATNCLLSISGLMIGGGWVEFKGNRCVLHSKKNEIIGKGRMMGMLFLLDARADLSGPHRTQYASSQRLSWDQWHRRYGHISINAIERLKLDQLVEGLKIDESTIPSQTCEACIQAKQAHRPFPQEAKNRSEVPGERIMSDVWGPARTESIGHWKYYISFTDDNTRITTAPFMKKKDQSFDRIQEYINVIEKKHGKVPKFMRFDNGKELVNDKLKKWAAEKGIIIETSAPYSPSQNGVAERFNRTLLELARAMLIAKNLPVFLWDEAITHAAYLRNRAPTRALEGKTPYEAWTGKKPDVSHLREFGCDVWVLDESKNRSKLSPKSNKFIFTGFNDGSKSVRYYDAKTRTIKSSRNVAFNENEEPQELEIITHLPGLRAEGEQDEYSDAQTTPNEAEKSIPTQRDNIPTSTPIILTPETPNEPLQRPIRRARQEIDYRRLDNPRARPSERLQEQQTPPDVTRATASSTAKNSPKHRALLAFEDFISEISEKSFEALTNPEKEDLLPNNLDEAMQSDEKEEWETAIAAEINMLKKWRLGGWRTYQKAEKLLAAVGSSIKSETSTGTSSNTKLDLLRKVSRRNRGRILTITGRLRL
jgi:hypothetical protein